MVQNGKEGVTMELPDHFYQFPVPTEVVIGYGKPSIPTYGRYWYSRSVYDIDGIERTHDEVSTMLHNGEIKQWPTNTVTYYHIERYVDVGDDGHVCFFLREIEETKDPEQYIKDMFAYYI
jgi:hypothetical protein